MQHITYTEYLPLVLDPAHLAPLAGPLQYDPQVDASVLYCTVLYCSVLYCTVRPPGGRLHRQLLLHGRPEVRPQHRAGDIKVRDAVWLVSRSWFICLSLERNFVKFEIV